MKFRAVRAHIAAADLCPLVISLTWSAQPPSEMHRHRRRSLEVKFPAIAVAAVGPVDSIRHGQWPIRADKAVKVDSERARGALDTMGNSLQMHLRDSSVGAGITSLRGHQHQTCAQNDYRCENPSTAIGHSGVPPRLDLIFGFDCFKPYVTVSAWPHRSREERIRLFLPVLRQRRRAGTAPTLQLSSWDGQRPESYPALLGFASARRRHAVNSL